MGEAGFWPALWFAGPAGVSAGRLSGGEERVIKGALTGGSGGLFAAAPEVSDLPPAKTAPRGIKSNKHNIRRKRESIPPIVVNLNALKKPLYFDRAIS